MCWLSGQQQDSAIKLLQVLLLLPAVWPVGEVTSLGCCTSQKRPGTAPASLSLKEKVNTQVLVTTTLRVQQKQAPHGRQVAEARGRNVTCPRPHSLFRTEPNANPGGFWLSSPWLPAGVRKGQPGSPLTLSATAGLHTPSGSLLPLRFPYTPSRNVNTIPSSWVGQKQAVGLSGWPVDLSFASPSSKPLYCPAA